MEFKRDLYLEKLKNRMWDGLIKVITGSRRAGKSYLLNEIFYNYLISHDVKDNQIIKFAFDFTEDIDKLEKYFPEEETKIYSDKKNDIYTVNAKKFRAYINDMTKDSQQYYLFLDEIQILDEFVGTLNGFLNHKNYDIYVTGSNSQMLSSNINTKFKGRKTTIHVLPLAFSEFITGFNNDINLLWKDYIITGGIPIVAKMNTFEEKIEYLKDLCEEIYIKDIIVHSGIRNESELNDLFNILSSCISTPVNPTKLSNTFKSVIKKDISDVTIKTYISLFEDAFLISSAKTFDVKGKNYINTPYKIYFEDIGVRNARINFRQIEETHIMENIIYNELRYRGYNVDIGRVTINEKKDSNDFSKGYFRKQLEIDFIANKGCEKIYIQSCLNLGEEDVSLREERPFKNISDNFRKIIITKDGLKPRKNVNGIEIIDLFDFLLNSKDVNL